MTIPKSYPSCLWSEAEKWYTWWFASQEWPGDVDMKVLWVLSWLASVEAELLRAVLPRRELDVISLSFSEHFLKKEFSSVNEFRILNSVKKTCRAEPTLYCSIVKVLSLREKCLFSWVSRWGTSLNWAFSWNFYGGTSLSFSKVLQYINPPRH